MQKNKHTFQYIFLLGGYDLEMVEIKEILDSHKLKYHDKNLSWGAKLSEYKKFFNDEDTFVGIELTEDIAPPAKYVAIDHHNDKADQLTAIGQIAGMLNIKLNRWQQLVATNDKGYIPAMEAICATNEEIEKIRKADRQAQGVTEEDEELAESSIAENLTTEKGITIIKSLISKFSPITDRMYGKTDKLLIYTNTELTYYGRGKDKLVEVFAEFIKKNKAFHGGGRDGFWGICKNVFDLKEIESLKEKIVEILLKI